MGDSLDRMSREELLNLAEDRGIEVRPEARKAEILAMLRQTEGASPAAHSGPVAALSDPTGGQFEAARAKFDLAPDGLPPASHDIPWGYGEIRIAAMARDPYWLYIYWEVTDEAIADARSRLGPGGPSSGCVLRVYDTTHRFFDGTNANAYFDVPVDRTWNNYFLRVDRPRAIFHVDIGLKSHEGYFAVMARSGAAEMPADNMASDGSVEWMTVVTHQRTPSLSPYRHRYVPRPVSSRPAEGPCGDIVPGALGIPLGWEVNFERVLAALVGGEAWQTGEWFEQVMGGRVVRWIRWAGGRRRVEWRAGPFAIPLTEMGPVEIWFHGRRHVVRAEPGGATRLEFGPWYVVIAGVGASGERRIIDTWMIRMAWMTGGGGERIESPYIYRRMLGAYRRRRVLAGASELWIGEEGGASEELFAGASERIWLGASETILGGASETFALGASERFWLGASERSWLGASEQFGLGASEVFWGGASEFAFAGGSERQFVGASEWLFGGASFLGGASMLGGASEILRGGASESVVGVSTGEGWCGLVVMPAPSGPLQGLGAPVSVSDVLPRAPGGTPVGRLEVFETEGTAGAKTSASQRDTRKKAKETGKEKAGGTEQITQKGSAAGKASAITKRPTRKGVAAGKKLPARQPAAAAQGSRAAAKTAPKTTRRRPAAPPAGLASAPKPRPAAGGRPPSRPMSKAKTRAAAAKPRPRRRSRR
jgi:hypothetical protein